MKSTTKTNILIGSFVGLCLLPILTGTVLKDENPETQMWLKGICFGAATAVAGYGNLRESSADLRAQRMKERRLENASFAFDRQNDILKAQRNLDTLVNQDEIIRTAQIARMGVMQSSLLNPEVVAYAMPQLINPTGAAQTSAAVTMEGKMVSGISPNLLSGSSAGGEFSPDEVVALYRKMMDKKTRNSLNTMIAGGSGDGKSFTMQALIDAWLYLNPDGIIMVVDRKNGSVPDGGKYAMLGKPGWACAPTYRNITDITQSKVPFPHVYGAMTPRLDVYLEWIWNYIKTYRRPAEEAVDGVYKPLNKKDDPLYCKETGRPAPLLVIVDDATAVMTAVADHPEGGRDAFQTATRLLTTIATEGRTDGIDLFWITHSVTLGDNKVPTPMLTAMKAIVGASLCNRTVMQHCGQSESISPEVLSKVQAQVAAGTGIYGMATSYLAIPYLPPCNAGEDKLWGEEFIKHERALRWMIHSPMPRVLDAVHHYVLRVNGYELGEKGVIQRKDGKPLEAPYALDKEQREPLTPKQFIDIWYKENGLDEASETEPVAA